MGYRIRYTKILTLRAWHPAFLGAVAGQVPVPAGTNLSLQERQDYLGYDLRRYLDIRPLPGAPDVVLRYGLRWAPNTQGGWLLGPDTFTVTDPLVRLTLGVYLRDPDFAARTDFGTPSLSGRVFHLTNAKLPLAATVDLTNGTGLQDSHFLPAGGYTVRFDQQPPGATATVQVRDPLGPGNPVRKTLSFPATNPPQTSYTLDLGDLPAAVYRFTSPQINSGNAVVGIRRAAPLLGIVTLQLADWIGSTFDIHFQPTNP